MANTQNGYRGSYSGFSADKTFEDQVYECYRGKSPDCYGKLVKFINDH
jgi:hypothetical protein